MGKAEMKKSHDNLRAACKDMVCAVRENPSAFDGIRIPTNTNVLTLTTTNRYLLIVLAHLV